MKGIVALLTVALCQFAAGARISSCAEEIKHTTHLDKGVFSSPQLKINDDYFLRALVPDYELKGAGFQCAKLWVQNNDNAEEGQGKSKIIQHLAVFSQFSISSRKEISAVPAGEVVTGEKDELVKSVITNYDFQRDNDFFAGEEEVRHPGVTYFRTLFIDDDFFAYWECDRHAPVSTTADDNRYFFTKDSKTTFETTHPQFEKFNAKPGDNGFEGNLELLKDTQIEFCLKENAQFKVDF